MDAHNKRLAKKRFHDVNKFTASSLVYKKELT